MRILIAEDEVSIAKALKVLLEKNKYSVDAVFDGEDALDYMLSTDYDAVVLDVMMPKKDGIEVLKEARRRGIKTPVMFLTAKSEIEDRVAGLDAGADDYLPKPFSFDEFAARIRALVRRSDSYTAAVITVSKTSLDCGSYVLRANGKEEKLNNKEFQLTELFFRYPRQIFSTERLMEKIWGFDSDAETDVVWTYIGFIRKKLRQIDADVEIKTVRGAGYALEEIKC